MVGQGRSALIRPRCAVREKMMSPRAVRGDVDTIESCEVRVVLRRLVLRSHVEEVRLRARARAVSGQATAAIESTVVVCVHASPVTWLYVPIFITDV